MALGFSILLGIRLKKIVFYYAVRKIFMVEPTINHGVKGGIIIYGK